MQMKEEYSVPNGEIIGIRMYRLIWRRLHKMCGGTFHGNSPRTIKLTFER